LSTVSAKLLWFCQFFFEGIAKTAKAPEMTLVAAPQRQTLARESCNGLAMALQGDCKHAAHWRRCSGDQRFLAN
jgi:hypothetical protein